MRKTYLLILLAVGACQATGPVKYLSKPGASAADKQAALDDCRIASLQAVPQSVGVSTSGGYYNPGTTQCSTIAGITSCNQVGAVNIPSQTTVYDRNEALRERQVDRCLRARGYSITLLPACRGDTEKAAARKAQSEGRAPTCAPGLLAI